MNNCYIAYEHKYNKNHICHYDEIDYWEVTETGSDIYYFPVLKSGKIMFGISGDENGKEQLEKYFAYKNKL
jgi:hypothetical protein